MPHRRRLKNSILSPRGWALFTMGAVGLARAWSYLEPGLTEPPGQLAYVGALIPISVYAFMWLAAGLGCFHAIVQARIVPYAVAVFVGMHLLWALSFIASWAFLESGRAWVSAISYTALAILAAVIARMIDPPDVLTPGEGNE